MKRDLKAGEEFAKKLGYDDLQHLQGKIEYEGQDYWLNSYEDFTKVQTLPVSKFIDDYNDAYEKLISEFTHMGLFDYQEEE